MKKIILVALLAFAGYKFYENGFSLSGNKGAFDKGGRPLVVMFDGPGCGEHCEKVVSTLKSRGVEFEVIRVVEDDGTPVKNKYGIRNYPTTLIGRHEIRGADMMGITAALAETYGSEVLTRSERMAMVNHFDDSGKPMVVMYATNWCGYCKKQREYFADNNIPYEEINVEASQDNKLLFAALQGNGYPLTYVGYRRFAGYEENGIDKAVKELKVK
jgi:glutaredoxin